MVMNWFQRIFRKQDAGELKIFVSGRSSKFDIIYKCQTTSNAIRETGISSGWKKNLKANKGDYFFCSVHANDKNSEANVAVYYKGQLLKKASAKGDYALAYTGGTLA